MPHSFKQLTRILTLVGALAAMGLACFPAQAQNKGDDTLLEMAQAFRKNDKARLSALLPQARGHVLEPLAAYWELRPRLDSASESEIRNFLNTYAGTYYEDRLRTDWLLQLGRRRDWATFTAEYPLYRMRDDREVRCYALVTEAINSKANVADEAKRLVSGELQTAKQQKRADTALVGSASLDAAGHARRHAHPAPSRLGTSGGGANQCGRSPVANARRRGGWAWGRLIVNVPVTCASSRPCCAWVFRWYRRLLGWSVVLLPCANGCNGAKSGKGWSKVCP